MTTYCRRPIFAGPTLPISRHGAGAAAPPPTAFELNKLEINSIYYALLDLYDEGNGLDRSSFAISPATFDALDANQNGKIDQGEIAAR